MSASDRPDRDAHREARDARLAALLAAAAAGDTAAFEAFYEATFAYARTVARRLLRDDAAVEDLLADCYFEAWRAAARFDPARGSAVTWLLTRVRSRGIDALRAEAARPDRWPAAGEGADRTGTYGLSVGVTVGGGAGSGVGRGADRGTCGPLIDGSGTTVGGAVDDTLETTPAADGGLGADPADLLWRRQAGAALQAALSTLSAAERWVLGLAYLRELSQAEIAQATGMPLGTVKSHALRAQQKLRSVLAGGAAAPAAARPEPPR